MFALIAAAILATALGGYYSIARRGTEPLQSMTIERLTNTGEVRRVAISSDGKYLAFSTGISRRPSLWVRQLATHSDLQLLPPEEGPFEGITFSSDANYIYYVHYSGNAAGELFRVPTLGGKPRKILSGVEAPITLSPDGQRVAFLRQSGSESQSLIVAGIDGGPEQSLAQRTAPEGFAGFGLSWSFDGKLIGVAAYSGGRCYIMTVPAGGGRLQQLGVDGWLHIRQLAWLPDSSGLALVSMQSNSSPGQIWRISYPGGKPHRITYDLNDYGYLSLAGDSKTLVASQGEVDSHIWRVPDGDASRATQLTFGAGTQDGVYGLDRTSSGLMVYASLSGGTRELWTKENGAASRQLTTDADIAFFATPSACPDGRTVVYGSGPYGKSSIWRADSENQKPEVLASGGTNGGPSCSPDGQWVYYNALSKYYTLWRVPLKGGTPEQFTQFPSTYPHVSPDGKRIAYLVAEPNRSAIGIIPVGGGAPKTLDVYRASPGGDQVFRWSPTGEGIEYVDTRNGVSNIWNQLIEGGSPQQVTNFGSGLIFDFVRLPGGKDMAVARGGTTSDVVRIRNFSMEQ